LSVAIASFIEALRKKKTLQFLKRYASFIEAIKRFDASIIEIRNLSIVQKLKRQIFHQSSAKPYVAGLCAVF